MRALVLAAAASCIAGAGLAMSGGVLGGHMDRAPPPAVVKIDRIALRQQHGSGRGLASRKRGPGWTHAKVQRMASKRRNQARHRATCKRRGTR